MELGFKYVAAGPLVRSSYRAAEAFLSGILRGHDAPYSDRYGKRRLEIVS
jgi:lipoic acid synthetase